jgi:hypothetical protein
MTHLRLLSSRDGRLCYGIAQVIAKVFGVYSAPSRCRKMARQCLIDRSEGGPRESATRRSGVQRCRADARSGVLRCFDGPDWGRASLGCSPEARGCHASLVTTGLEPISVGCDPEVTLGALHKPPVASTRRCGCRNGILVRGSFSDKPSETLKLRESSELSSNPDKFACSQCPSPRSSSTQQRYSQ